MPIIEHTMCHMYRVSVLSIWMPRLFVLALSQFYSSSYLIFDAQPWWAFLISINTRNASAKYCALLLIYLRQTNRLLKSKSWKQQIDFVSLKDRQASLFSLGEMKDYSQYLPSNLSPYTPLKPFVTVSSTILELLTYFFAFLYAYQLNIRAFSACQTSSDIYAVLHLTWSILIINSGRNLQLSEPFKLILTTNTCNADSLYHLKIDL